MMHDVHTGPSAAIFDDSCRECKERGADPYRALCQMDTYSFEHAWWRAGQLQTDGLPDGQQAELPTLRALIGVQLHLERRGIPLGVLPTAQPNAPAFVLEVGTANSWFENRSLSVGLAEILEDEAAKLRARGVDDDATIMDGNGNTVGRYRYTT